MTFIRRIGNRTVVCRRIGNKRGKLRDKEGNIYTWFVVKNMSRVAMNDICFPNSWDGKKIRIIVEEVKDDGGERR